VPSGRTRWVTGWTLTGIIATPIFSYALNGPYLERVSALLAGGTVAVGAGAWTAATQAGRNARADVVISACAYLIAALLFLALLSTGTSQEYNSYSSALSVNRQFDPLLYTGLALCVFGVIFGVAMGTYYNRRPLRLALAFPPLALLAGLSTFVVALFLAGYNLITPLVGSAKVPIGLVLGGFLGMLLPGRAVESLLSRDVH
jgi:hypothetical protein